MTIPKNSQNKCNGFEIPHQKKKKEGQGRENGDQNGTRLVTAETGWRVHQFSSSFA